MSERLLLDEGTQLELGMSLYKAGLFGIKENPNDYITLKSGRKSPHYFDIRPGISNIDLREDISYAMSDLAKAKADERGFKQGVTKAYDHFVGTPEAMTSYAMLIAYIGNMSLLQPRVDQNKATGNKTPVLGNYSQGDLIAAFDDVVTDGQSKIDMIGSLTASGLVVVDYFVAVDREEGGALQVFAETGVEVTPALAVSSLVTMLHSQGEITQTQHDNVAEYIGQYGDPHAQVLMNVA